jgi:hypothetical protein
LTDLLAAAWAVDAGLLQRQRHVAGRRPLPQQRLPWRHDADPRPRGPQAALVEGGGVETVQPEGAAVRPLPQGEHPGQGGLAGAGCSDDAGDDAGRDVEGDVVQREDRAGATSERLGQVFNGDHEVLQSRRARRPGRASKSAHEGLGVGR